MAWKKERQDNLGDGLWSAQDKGRNLSLSVSERMTSGSGGDMDKLRAMRFFCRSVESGSFATAAAALDVVPSALSKTIAALERDIGFRLMNRSTRRMSLTEEGSTYYESCRGILQQIDDMEAVSRSGRHQLKGSLRVGMHPALRELLLTRLGRFVEANANIQIETDVTNSASAVLERGLDVLLHIGTLADSNLVVRRLSWVRPVVCASPSYLQAWGIPHHPDDLKRHRAVIYGRADEQSNATWAFIRGGESHRVGVPVWLVVRDGIGVTDAVAGGCGIGRPFDIAIHRLLCSGAVHALLPDWDGPRYAVSAVTPAGRPSIKVAAFIDFCGDVLSPADVRKAESHAHAGQAAPTK
jgi:LysR family transcriptional regulator for bpeEF and oprC